jgi:hypothetical protein
LRKSRDYFRCIDDLGGGIDESSVKIPWQEPYLLLQIRAAEADCTTDDAKADEFLIRD